ncbi:cytochrome c oxidase accessory protein CcoG [Herbaspirillum sp. VT-16-41]|uniref:cytochrome c oxidase accessory protein CcoG n=1 Tax=Herbaspirillum sp. VT-16-41 TaxID=1953765 RepID=UPI000981C7FF|nr:cytochrome c oxidase accessory protein CcoG [Herbaspirillum sp. VT-16-41]ONN66482.1 cytochrome c oxidase accessory protein CcoG [Herbaspirillum sp. VT-16-41]
MDKAVTKPGQDKEGDLPPQSADSKDGKDGKEEYAVIRMYAAREPIYPREIQGRFASLRWLCVFLTQLVFYGLPWINWNERQAVLFDLASRKFYLFGLVLWPQDFIWLAALLIICAFSLFLFTAVAGRVWCGYACPQTVYTEIFLWIERRIEGNRSARMRLDRQGWSFDKLWRKSAKHLAWGALALWTGISFVGYFSPIRDLLPEIGSLALGPWEMFWIGFYGFATYGNAGWMREQVCKYMCPYARFQSAMFDRDSLIITYDAARGEPRMPAARAAKLETGGKAGDCIDCTMCVQVCPTGIDIRQGLQYMCIGCAACVDACDSVMDKIKRPRGLIRYSTENAVEQGFSTSEIRRRLLRPRILIYTAILGVVIALFASSLWIRTPLKLDVIRDRGSMGREVEDGIIENVYRLQVINTDERGHRYRISASGIDGLTVDPAEPIEMAATQTLMVPIRVRAPHGAGEVGSNKIRIALQAEDQPSVQVSEKAVFLVPRR